LNQKYRVLIVDDSPELRLLIKMALETSEYELLEAANALEGLMMINQHRPDVVLLDVMMPGKMDGLSLCQRIKQDPVLKTTYVIMLSARGQQDDIQRAKENGADDYVVKPFSPVELIQRLDDRRVGGLV
jgi:CheY-like chemotaxis protein